MSLGNVKSFYEYLEDNEAFRDQIKAAECFIVSLPKG